MRTCSIIWEGEKFDEPTCKKSNLRLVSKLLRFAQASLSIRTISELR